MFIKLGTKVMAALMAVLVISFTVYANSYESCAVERGNISDVTINAEWNGKSVEDYFSVSLFNAYDKATITLNFSDDESYWEPIQELTLVPKNTTVTLVDTGTLEINRKWNITDYKDSKNSKVYGPFTLYDVLESIKPDFCVWLEEKYREMFNVDKMPETLDELYKAFGFYYSMPQLEIQNRTDDDGVSYVDSSISKEGAYDYVWEYQDESGNWKLLTNTKESTICASEYTEQLDGGANIRCSAYYEGSIISLSDTLFCDPIQAKYDRAIEIINEELDLAHTDIYYRVQNKTLSKKTVDLSIGETRFENYFFFGNVAQDLPVSDSKTFKNYLAELYYDSGGGDAGLQAVKSVWDRYLYDMYDPSYDAGGLSNITEGIYPDNTYGDQFIKWPKDTLSSFNTNPNLIPTLRNLNYDYENEGVDYSSFIDSDNGLEKSVTAVAAGDNNTERKYDVELSTEVSAKGKKPVAMILQIQTSWQIFDLLHANCVKGDGTYASIEVGSAAYNTELANLYAIKKALIQFADYMETEYPGNNLVIGITETQHGKSSSLFYQGAVNKQSKSLYVTNDTDKIREGLYQWNTFGNCEHVHYDSDTLKAACLALESNLSGWTDSVGYEIKYDDIQKVAVILGGSTENSASTNGYAITLPWSTFSSAGLNSVYGIRLNEGVPVEGNVDGCISWLEYKTNYGDGKTKYVDGVGNTYTDYNVATSSEAVYKELVRIANAEISKESDVEISEKYKIENVSVSDTIENEFELDKNQKVVAVITDSKGVETRTDISLDDPNLLIEEKGGYTEVSYNFGTLYSGSKARLQFGIVAKADYIGSNNVKSNVGTPKLTYQHVKKDSSGVPTGDVTTFNVKCDDEPEVNVPIRFTSDDGGCTSVPINTKVDLSTLEVDKITTELHELLDNYDQISGTVSYTWILPDGTEQEVDYIVLVKDGELLNNLPTSEDLRAEWIPTEEKDYVATLKLKFTPNDVVDSGCFSDEKTKEAVSSKTDGGNVTINAFFVEYALPNSGGPGTYLFTLFGIALMAFALMMSINKRRA